jgi:release factor glutamine methyltransferase
VLAEHVLGWDTARVLMDGHAAPPPSFRSAYEAAVARRTSREPVAYITGVKEFWNLTVEVSPAVLVPRPETEGIIEQVLAQRTNRTAALTIADVCTGSGCLAVVLAAEYPRAHITASDISREALEVAGRNARRHHVEDRVRFVQDDLLTNQRGPFDVIVANPPYVPAAERSMIQPEVRFEPDVALYAGADGLNVIRRLLADAAPRLAPGGLLLFEFGFGQSQAVADLISSTRILRMIGVASDFSGIPRIALAERV